MLGRGPVGGVLIAAAIVTVSCGGEQGEVEQVARPVKMLKIGLGEAGERREYSGTIAAVQTARMSFEVAGQILEIPVNEGDEVEKGTVLARLDPRDYQARLDKAAASLRKAQADYGRALSLRREDAGAIAPMQVDSFRRGQEVAEAEFREVEKAFEDTVLRAPFKGQVARKFYKEFVSVQAKQEVLILEDTTSLEIKVTVPERDMATNSRGSRQRETPEEVTKRLHPEVIVTSLPDRVFPAVAKEISLTADPVTRTFEATFGFDPPEDALVLPGMTAMARITLRGGTTETQGIVIPVEAAVATDDGEAFVWLVDQDSMTVARRPVRLGNLMTDTLAIVEGLGDGDVIAVSGIQHLREGMKVSRYDG